MNTTDKPFAETREQWLELAVKALQDRVFDQADLQIPPVRVSCSWPGGGKAYKRIGECWPRSASQSGLNEVFISPMLDEPTRVLDVLAHELCHAIDDCKHGHNAPFTRMTKAIGLEGKPTATVASAALMMVFVEDVLPALPAYPHAKLTPSGPVTKAPRAAFAKFTCKHCEMVFRATAAHAVNVKQCPACGEADLETELS